MFRFKRAVNVSYNRQGYIYFLSRSYKRLRQRDRERIRKHCEKVAGKNAENMEALFEFVTTDDTATAICLRHYIGSKTTLDRLVKIYYETFPADL